MSDFQTSNSNVQEDEAVQFCESVSGHISKPHTARSPHALAYSALSDLPGSCGAEAGPGDGVGQVCVRGFWVSEVQVALSEVDDLGLLDRDRANDAGNLVRQLVLHWRDMNHHRLAGGKKS